jgi:transcriptional regulator with GAF, ATPase, and Fis domain
MPEMDRLDAFDDLLAALARGLDIREIFQHVSAAAARIVPHDEADLALLSDDRTMLRIHASTGNGAERCVSVGEFAPFVPDITQPAIVNNLPGASCKGFLSIVSAPVKLDGDVAGLFCLLSRKPNAYSENCLRETERLARYLGLALAHQRLAEQARDAALQRERAASIEGSAELLRTLGNVLDVRSIFTRISEIAQTMIAHDAMAMVFFDEDGQVALQAVSADDFPTFISHRAKMPLPPFMLIGDLATQGLGVVEGDNPVDRLLAAGYRSFISTSTRAREQMLSVGFVAKKPHQFSERDLPTVRRIADYIALAVSHEQLAEAAKQVAEAQARADRLEARVQLLSDELDLKTHARVVGESAEWRDVLKKATQVAATDTTVLLTGESGTGKEVVARFIHRASGRKTGPFVALNCAALPEQLLESELFGYERGAFTSAQQSKPGQIELAAGGVLFLDEVSEMSLPAQAKFLRVLQEREFQRLGGTKMLKANIRVIAATNRDLEKAVERGDFRQDLFYRLQVFDIHIAPLRDRRDDIVPLSEAFLQDIGRSFGRPPAGLSRDAREALLRYDWPGNVRELANALERAAILCEGGLINASHLSLRAAAKPPAMMSITNLNTVERDTIAQVLKDTRWNKSKAAAKLGLSRTQLYVRLRKYGLEQPPIEA